MGKENFGKTVEEEMLQTHELSQLGTVSNQKQKMKTCSGIKNKDRKKPITKKNKKLFRN